MLDAIAAGASYRLAAFAAGVHPDTLDNWRRQGEARPQSDYGLFLTRLKIAEGQAAVKWLKAMDPLPKGWQAMAWKLERRHPEDYALKRDDATERLAAAFLQFGRGGDDPRGKDL